jgi:large subunit ribosomal protein L30
MLKITLTKGLIGKTETQRKVITALGLGKYGSSVVRADSPTIRGMVNKVSHLVTVVEDKTAKPKEKPAKKTARPNK